MLKLLVNESTQTDTLRECVEIVLAFHHRRSDLAGLISELPVANSRLSMATLPALAERLDCSLKIVNSGMDELSGIRSPVIMLLRDGEFAVVLPSNDGVLEFQLPGNPPEPLTDTRFTKWCTSRVIMLMPKHSVTESVVEHMAVDEPIDWFWQPILRYTPNFIEVVVCTVFINFLVVALPLFTLNVYDAVVPNLALSTLTVLALGVSIAIVFDVLLKSARTSILERIAARTGTQFDSELMRRMLSVKEENMCLSIGERYNLFRELQGLRDFYATRLVPALVDFPFFLLFLFVIYLISPALTLVPIAIACAILLLNMLVHIPVRRSTKALFSSNQEKSSMMVELLSGTAALKQLTAVGPSLHRWGYVSDRAAESSRRSQRWISFAQHGSLGLMQLNHVLIVVVGVYQIKAGNLTVGGLVASTILASRTITPILNLHEVVCRWTQSRDCLKTIDALFNSEVDRIDSHILPECRMSGSISVSDFSYCYSEQSLPAVKAVNLTIKSGEHVCFIGPSGAGKSTLARAIAGALDVQQGRICLDDHDYRFLTAARVRSSVALIPQHPFFISGTVRENLLLGIFHCTDEALSNAVSLAGVDQVFADTGAGLDTEVRENGNQLSGGQRQAISIARAILRDSPVLVFDEPTNGLDSALEVHFMQTMKSFTHNKTLIMVTHRMSLLPLADRVVVMNNGHIVADDKRDVVMQRFAA